MSLSARMCVLLRRHVPSRLAGCHVHQLKPGIDVGRGLSNAI